MNKCSKCGVLDGSGAHDLACPFSSQDFWVKIADLVDHEIQRATSGLINKQIVTASRLADIGAPMIWCAALVAVSAQADRPQFLHICGQLFDKAQVAYASGVPMSALLNPDQTRGKA